METQFPYKAILKASAEGDRKAQYQLYQRVMPYLLKICRRYAKNDEDARDLLSSGFVKLVKSLNNETMFNDDEHFEAWAKRLQISVCIDEFRKNERYRKTITTVEDEKLTFLEHSNSENNALSNLGREEIENLVRQLPDVTREVFNLNIVEGFQHNEIAEMLQIPETTSRWHLHKARTIIKEKVNALYQLPKP